MKKLMALLLFLVYHFVSAQNARFFIPYREGNKWGFCDTLGKVKIAPQFSEVNFFEERNKTYYNYAKVKKDTIEFYIDTLGKPYIPTEYSQVNMLTYNDEIYFSVVNSKGKHGLYNNRKKILNCDFNQIEQLHNNKFLVNNKNKVGLINAKGDVLIPIQFDNIKLSKKYSTKEKLVWLAYKGDNATTFFDEIGKDGLDSTASYFNYDYKEIQEENKKQQEEIKRKNNGLNNNQIDAISNAMDTVAEKESQESKNINDSLINMMKALKLKYKLDSISSISFNPKEKDYFFYAEKEKYAGIIDDSLKLFMLGKKYDIEEIIINSRISWLYNDYQSLALFIYVKNEKYGLTNEFDDVLLEPIYDNIEYDEQGEAFFISKNNKIKFLNINSYNKGSSKYYSSLVFERFIKVNDYWNYNIFRVMDENNNLIGYVGENGLEYFKNVIPNNQIIKKTVKYKSVLN